FPYTTLFRSLVGQLGRLLVKQRVRLQGELVVRDVLGLKRDGGVDVGGGLVAALARQAEHDVDVEVVEPGRARRLHRRTGAARVMDAPDVLEQPVVEALHADRQAVDASRAIAGEAGAVAGAGVGLQRDLDAVDERRAGGDAIDHRRNGPG